MSLGSVLSDTVKSLCVASENGLLVIEREIFAILDVPKLDTARVGIETFMRKIGGENKRLIANFANGIAEAVIVAVKADKNSAGFDVAAKVFARQDIGFGAR